MSDITALKEGIISFAKRNCFENSSYNQMVTNGQKPKIMVIACSDSMVDPAVLTHAGSGELFIHRNISGLVPPYQPEERNHYHGTSAVIEFGVTGLEVEHIIVLTHGNCGGIKSMLQDHIYVGKESFVAAWMRMAKPVLDKMLSDLPQDAPLAEKQIYCEQETAKLSLENLMTFPYINERIRDGKLQLHAWHFDRGIFTVLH